MGEKPVMFLGRGETFIEVSEDEMAAFTGAQIDARKFLRAMG